MTAEVFFAAARAEVTRQARGLPAPLRCVDAVEAVGHAAVRGGTGAASAATSSNSCSRRNRRHCGTRSSPSATAAKIPDVPEDTPTRPIRSAAVLGFGTMGGGIAMSFANAGIPVTVFEKDQAALDRGLRDVPSQLGGDREEGTPDGRTGRAARRAAASPRWTSTRSAVPTSSSRRSTRTWSSSRTSSPGSMR